MIDLHRTHAMRIMGKDLEKYLHVYNKIHEVPDSQEGTLALQPLTDAIGLKYSTQRVVRDQVVITEGYTELVYLRAFAKVLGYEASDMSPVLGDGKIKTLVSFLVSQGMAFKVLIDEKARKQELQDHINIPDDSIFVIEEHLKGKPGNTVGVEDLMSRNDFRELLTLASQPINHQKLENVSNSQYARSKIIGKRIKGLLADSFSEEVSASSSTALPLEAETKDNFEAVLEFCNNPEWFRA